MILVVDASALVAIGLDEPERTRMQGCLQEADEAVVAPVNLTEAGLALVLRHAKFTASQFHEWVQGHGIAERHVAGIDALAAYLQYGKGVHRAGLNLGDCFAYALAKQLEAPLLYKGADFVFTDVRSALQPT